MSALIYFVFLIIDFAPNPIVWLVIANAVVSWLIAFDVINLRNRGAYNAVKMLDRVVSPLLAPFRRFIPPIGGMDITPVILIHPHRRHPARPAAGGLPVAGEPGRRPGAQT